MSTPMSTIKICSGVMLNNTYQHTIWFEDSLAQMRYFEGKVVKTFSSYSYLRKKWNIKVDATPEQAQSWTYLFFRNSNNGKYYFYFINSIEYINENTVELSLELDVMQTYLEEYTLAQSFVEREHSATDEIGDNILDEGLELGELIECDGTDYSLRDLCVLILSSLDIVNTTEDTNHYVINANVDNVFTGLAIYMVESSNYTALADKLKDLDKWGKSDCIVFMWMYPRQLVELVEGASGTFNLVDGIKSVDFDHEFTYEMYKEDGTLVRNKKLYTYPFNFLYMTNHCGGSAVYHFEKFKDVAIGKFRMTGALSAEASCKFYPRNYELDGYDAGLSMGTYPTCAWNQDVYKLWLAQNQNQREHAVNTANIQMGVGVMTALGSVMTGNLIGAGGGLATAYHGYNQVQSLMAQKKDMEIAPPQSKGSYSANVNIAESKQNFVLMTKRVDPYHAQMIDNYFDVYGYKCNLVKIPNTHVRENYTYTKTVGCNVYGNLCMEDLTKIKSIFDNGITFWVNGDLIGNYGLSNNCL